MPDTLTRQQRSERMSRVRNKDTAPEMRARSLVHSLGYRFRLHSRHLIDIVTGGPPCQPFSIGGRHRANDDHRDMWSEAVRALREARPRAFIFENVKGLTRQSFATYLGYILLQLHYPSLERGAREGWRHHLRRLQSHHTRGGMDAPSFVQVSSWRVGGFG